ncbi:hypothetical protein ABE28_012355 [Peribacillus muralis]|uniref:Uncharacterized protein n=1 Tax=Peribacillus muralis TaxID=264697 RepID=A0A1B3XPK2_9BACI|nr:hypothetical protein [Peribacillus muralis]AOH55142.1 hypothetical protein ABE28_012355 [Peribacillus muralis]
MSFVIYDCIQFISFNADETFSTASFLEENEHIQVSLLKTEDKDKYLYINHYFKENVFRMYDQEFLGEFDEWKTLNKVPKEIQSFSLELNRIVKDESISNVSIILIDYVDELEEENNIVTVHTASTSIIEGLFKASIFKSEGNIFIMDIN